MKEKNYSMFETFHYFIIKIKKKLLKGKIKQFAVISHRHSMSSTITKIYILCYLKYLFLFFNF